MGWSLVLYQIGFIFNLGFGIENKGKTRKKEKNYIKCEACSSVFSVKRPDKLRGLSIMFVGSSRIKELWVMLLIPSSGKLFCDERASLDHSTELADSKPKLETGLGESGCKVLTLGLCFDF